MNARFHGRNQVAIIGYAQSPVLRSAMESLGQLTITTALSAIKDAGLHVAQIDGFTTGSLLPAYGDTSVVDGRDIVSGQWLAERLSIHPRWSCDFSGYGQLPGSVILAVEALLSGSAEYVLLHRSLSNPTGKYHDSAIVNAVGDKQWTAPQGLWGPPVEVAFVANEYMHRYGTSRADLGRVVVNLREAGAQNPWSYWHGKPITLADYELAPLIADPISRLDCDIPVQSASAFVLTRADRAIDGPHKPVWVTGWAQGRPNTPLKAYWTLDEMNAAGNRTAQMLYEHTGLAVTDIDHPQLYDAFSPFLYFWTEALGFCGAGEAAAFLVDGGGERLGMFNSGGSLGNGRLHGLAQMLDCYLQLSGRAGDRQLHQPTVGLAAHASPIVGGVVAYSAEQF